MLVAYENLLRLPPEALGEKTEFTACAAGRIMLTLSTGDFSIDLKDGKASVLLCRHLSNEQARELAAALVKKVDELEAQQKQFTTIVQSQGGVQGFVTPLDGHNI